MNTLSITPSDSAFHLMLFEVPQVLSVHLTESLPGHQGRAELSAVWWRAARCAGKQNTAGCSAQQEPASTHVLLLRKFTGTVLVRNHITEWLHHRFAPGHKQPSKANAPAEQPQLALLSPSERRHQGGRRNLGKH